MKDIYLRGGDRGLTGEEIRGGLERALEGRKLNRVLILPPDFTRYHSNAGFITNCLWKMLRARGAQVDIMPALGTHKPVSREQWEFMFGNIPFEEMLVHNWKTEVTRIGTVSADYVSQISEGLWPREISVEINRRLLDESYDLIISVGQVVPHEVVGMANYTKNLFVGAGGVNMINESHMLGAVYGMERIMGRADTPVRRLYNYAKDNFLASGPIMFALTVTTAPAGQILTHGLFIGEDKACYDEACKLAAEKNLDYISGGIKKCVVYLDPTEFTSTWLGNKAVYRTRMAIADGGELIILAPGVESFGEDGDCDRIIRKYGYHGRISTLEAFNNPGNEDLRENMSAAAHLIHGSSDGRFNITYAVKKMSREEIENAGFIWADYDEVSKKYDPAKLQYGFNTVDGEEIFFIPNPALGLWIDPERI